MAEETPGKTLYLIDGTSNIYRAYYAIRGLSNSSGRPTNATYGFTQMLRKLLQDEDPEYLAVAFDRAEPTHRHASFPSYKAHRQAPPEDLIQQIPDIKEVCRALGVPIVEVPGFEADDLMGTLAVKSSAAGFRVVLVTSDKDLLQLVGENVVVLHPSRGEKLDREGVKRSFGVYPEQVVDVLALMGDSSDNIPGVPGIGEKGARDLISTYGSLEETLKRRSEIARKTYRESLEKHEREARQSRELVTLHPDAPLDWSPADYRRRSPSRPEALQLFRDLGFVKLVEELEEAPEASGVTPSAVLPVSDPHPIRSRAELGDLVQILSARGRAALYPVFSSSDPMRATLLGLGVAAEPGVEFFMAWGGGGEAELAERECWEGLRGFLENAASAKLSDNLKGLDVYLRRQGILLRGGTFDSTLVAYVLNPEGRDYTLDRLRGSILGEGSMGPDLSEAGMARKAARNCRTLLALEGPLLEQLQGRSLEKLYRDIELPLTRVLAGMEFTGVRIDSEFLRELGRKWSGELQEMEARVYGLAGESFNIQSPRQLGHVLFEKLGLTPGRKTEKVKTYSTGVDVLESLAPTHPLPAAVLEYRSLAKLLSTYIEALPGLVNPATGRVHASFHQTTAATGRLSSSDPNLQNIPIRTRRGREIRRAFIARDGWQILTADYSQIELRVLAHLAKEEEMIRAFRSGEDIHRRTAAEVFGVAPELVTPSMRYQAKAINFGILYGMGPFRLSRELGIPQAAAKRIIEEYFLRFEGVKRYVETVIRSAEESGFVSTLFGRIRPVPEIRSRNTNLRNQGIRVAVNTTVQGTAADLIKIAMLELDRRLEEEGLASRLLIQVHDELVLEAPEQERSQVSAMVRECMQGCYPLEVPLVAEVRSGASWLETKEGEAERAPID